MKKGWPTKTLGEVCQFRGGGTPSKAVERYWLGNIPWVSPKDMKFDVVSDSIDHISQEAIDGSATSLIPKNSVLMVVRSGILARIVPIAITGRDLTINQDLKALCPNGAMDARFLYHLLDSKMDELLSMVSRGATVHRLMTDQIRNLDFVLPPLAEQQRIVGLLDEAFEGLATAKSNAEKNLQNARALFESHLQSVFTQRGAGWVETTLGEVIEIVGGSQPPKSVFSKTKKAENIRLIQIRDYKSDKHVVFIPRDQARRFCNADDVMIGRYGPPLFQILRGIEGAYNVALMKAVPDEAKLSRDFLFYFLKHSAILQYVIYHSSRAAGQIGVTKETLEPYPIALPSLAEQRKVVENIQELETETQRLARLYERKHAALEALKKSLLHQAFTGQL